MATTITSIHKANDSNGFNVTFQVDYLIGASHAVMHIVHTSPGRTRNTEIDVPLLELVELQKTIAQILDESPANPLWCSTCKGAGEIATELTGSIVSCPDCGGRGMVKDG